MFIGLELGRVFWVGEYFGDFFLCDIEVKVRVGFFQEDVQSEKKKIEFWRYLMFYVRKILRKLGDRSLIILVFVRYGGRMVGFLFLLQNFSLLVRVNSKMQDIKGVKLRYGFQGFFCRVFICFLGEFLDCYSF